MYVSTEQIKSVGSSIPGSCIVCDGCGLVRIAERRDGNAAVIPVGDTRGWRVAVGDGKRVDTCGGCLKRETAQTEK